MDIWFAPTGHDSLPFRVEIHTFIPRMSHCVIFFRRQQLYCSFFSSLKSKGSRERFTDHCCSSVTVDQNVTLSSFSFADINRTLTTSRLLFLLKPEVAEVRRVVGGFIDDLL